jgi:hypothetical protein
VLVKLYKCKKFKIKTYKLFQLTHSPPLGYGDLCSTGMVLWSVASLVRGASKIKLKNVNKKRMATARRLIFLEFLKASIADLITPFFSSSQNSEGGGNSDSGDSFADPSQFLPL